MSAVQYKVSQIRQLDCSGFSTETRKLSASALSLVALSVNSVEVLRGLQAGDQVVLSDMSAWDSYDRIRLE